MRPDDLAGVRRWAESSLKAADRGSRLTSQLLAFSRTQQIDVQPIDLERLVRGMSELLQATVGRHIRPVYELVSSRVPVLADPVQLELAILNLAINARDAMPGGGQLCITTRLREIGTDPELAPGEYLELSVADTGCGMSDSVRQRAFDPFFTTKGVGEGSGLGLAQVYGIARQAGGAARIVSRPGAGTTVTLLLRQAGRPAPQVRVAARDESRPPGNAKPRILVIDDDPEIRSLLVETLEWSGYEVRDAGDGAAGLAMMEADPPDLLLVDYLMPGLSGAEVVKRARASGLTTPVIFATGYSNTLALNDAIGFKAVVLPKPFTLGELQQAVEAALAAGGRPTLRRRLA
jgi:CheY-like chemotaxis protein